MVRFLRSVVSCCCCCCCCSSPSVHVSVPGLPCCSGEGGSGEGGSNVLPSRSRKSMPPDKDKSSWLCLETSSSSPHPRSTADAVFRLLCSVSSWSRVSSGGEFSRVIELPFSSRGALDPVSGRGGNRPAPSPVAPSPSSYFSRPVADTGSQVGNGDSITTRRFPFGFAT